eukprot:CAMPEP_0119409122 /NCGR_PEP_ID=MMETSP1335-20130426/2482_1 /TAXON_ID=259385 /ORGANISM="Chrysoculter rhomboideus, Strain RCC1486" /LENGTH=357 /DNA_ID=CAMNT_0007433451 /DNA_START=70 /DNA_END=1143 /DNA_ORIENTATION=-
MSPPMEAEAASGSFRRRRLTVDALATALPKIESTRSGGKRHRSHRMSTELGTKLDESSLLFEKTVVGTFSCHGIEPSEEGQPHAKINQDRGLVWYPLADDRSTACFAVFDGHGASGDSCSHFTATAMRLVLESHPALMTEPQRALRESFLRVDGLLKCEESVDSEVSGTTATVALLSGSTLHLAWVGDSRAVLARSALAKDGSKAYTAIDLSRDHKPDSKLEHARICARGGYVTPAQEWGGPARVWMTPARELPGLAMSRSIGDHVATPIGVVADPELTSHELTPSDEFLILASDGVWEFIDSQTAVDIVAPVLRSRGASMACTKLILAAGEHWREEEGDYRDDITAIVVKLPCFKH